MATVFHVVGAGWDFQVSLSQDNAKNVLDISVASIASVSTIDANMSPNAVDPLAASMDTSCAKIFAEFTVSTPGSPDGYTGAYHYYPL